MPQGVVADADERIRCALDRVAHELAGGEPMEVLARQTTAAHHVLRVRAAVGGGGLDAFVKLTRTDAWSDELHEEHHRTRRLAEALRPLSPDAAVAAPLAYHAEPPQTLVLAAAEGTPLHETIRRAGRGADAALLTACGARVEALGRAVRRLEDASAGAGDGAEAYEAILATAERSAARVQAHPLRRVLGEAARTCLERVRQARQVIERQPVTLAHGDLHPANVFVTDPPHRVTLIDAALSRPQPRGYDAWYFRFQLARTCPRRRCRPRALGAVLEYFDQGYGRALPENVGGAIQALLLLNAMAYTTTLAGQGGLLRRLACIRDARQLDCQSRRL